MVIIDDPTIPWVATCPLFGGMFGKSLFSEIARLVDQPETESDSDSDLLGSHSMTSPPST
jgi:hypothetical protein